MYSTHARTPTHLITHSQKQTKNIRKYECEYISRTRACMQTHSLTHLNTHSQKYIRKYECQYSCNRVQSLEFAPYDNSEAVNSEKSAACVKTHFTQISENPS